jgi:phosphate acetyltransferase
MAAEFIENHTYNEIRVGQSAALQRTLTRDDIALFSKVSGDLNPTHLNAEYARSSAAGEITGHSLWNSGLISSLLGNVLPGPGTVYRKQNMQFHHPVALHDTVTARVKVQEKRANNLVLFECDVVNQRGDTVMTGLAEVIAPSEKVSLPKAELPEISLRYHDSYAQLLESARGLEPIPTAVIHPCDAISLEGAIEAAQDGLIIPVLVGPEQRLRNIAEAHGIDLADYRIIDVMHSHAAAARAVELVQGGQAEILMKGSLHTDEVLGAVVSSHTGLRTERRISHIFAMDVPTYPKLLLITDAAVNIAPGLEAKRDICQNAIDLAHAFDIEQPRLAILSAVETVNPKIQSTLDAAALCKMADRGQIQGGLLDGPLAMDNAISLEAAQTKGITSRVAGQADVLVAPDLEAGNILAKQLTFLANADAAGIVLGARVPIILTSRADNVRARRASAATAVMYAHALRKHAVAGFKR